MKGVEPVLNEVNYGFKFKYLDTLIVHIYYVLVSPGLTLLSNTPGVNLIYALFLQVNIK